MEFIVAVDRNWAIGKDNRLLFRLPYDLSVNFKGKTTGNTIVVGSVTLKSFPKSRPLPNRRNVVLCNTGERFDGCEMVGSVEELREIVRATEGKTFVCGGASIYRLLVPYCVGGYVTKVLECAEGADVFFPDIDGQENWSIDSQSEVIDDNGHKIVICHYVNNSKEVW